MRRGIAFAVVTGALALPGGALGATTFCVPDDTIAGCPSGSMPASDVPAAVASASAGDTIRIGPGTFPKTASDGGTALHFIGEGEAQTLIQGQGVTAMTVSSGSTVSNLTVNLAAGPGNSGLLLAGSATNVAITATSPLNTANNIGVVLNGGTFSHGSVTLPLAATEALHYAGVIGSGTVADSSITAPVGVATDSSATSPTVTRDVITATQGVLAGTNGPTVEDSLIHTVAGSSSQLGVGLDANLIFGSFTLRHDTVIGSPGAGSTGVALSAAGITIPATSSATIDSSIIRGYVTSVSATATSLPPGSASSTVTITHTFYDPSAVHTTPNDATDTATITLDTASGDHDPLIVNPGASDFHLQAGSPAIDAGETALASGESATDLDGNPRAIAGHNGDPATTDIGAYEFQPHTPTGVAARVQSATVIAGTPDTFGAQGGDTSPGDSVSFTWAFDDGGSASGATVTHIFTTGGHHSATVTATDLDGFTATATVALTVIPPPPRITRLRIRPKSVRSGRRLTITYDDSEAGTTRFTVQRFVEHHTFKDVGAFRHASSQGANKVTYRPHRFPGRFRIVAVPSDAAGAGPAVSARFTIVRTKR